MSEIDFPASQESALPANTSAMPSAGTILRLAREGQGIHIDTLAVAMKIPVKKLEALEGDRYDLLPDTVFARALASSICRTLKIDPAPVLERLPSNIAPRLKTDESGINTPFRVATQEAGGAYLEHLSKPVVLAVLALLVGALVIIFLPVGSLTEFFGGVKSDGTSVTSEVSTTSTLQSPTEQLGDAVPTLNSSLSISVPPEPLPAATEAAATLDSIAATPLVAEKVPVTAVITGLISFKAKGASWVEVVDAKGVTQLNKTLGDGEVASASGTLPLKVVVGHTENTEVQLRGEPFDLAKVSKNNVARFEVK